MKRRRLAETLTVSALGLGCMGMSEFYGDADASDSLRVLHRAVELGIDFFDTADTYGFGANEELLGRFLRETAQTVTIASKFGIMREPGAYARSINTSPRYAEAACEASLKRLGLECIDLFYVHRLDAGRAIEETMEALARLVRRGLIRHVGLCEVSGETLRRAHAIHPVSVVQSEYSLWTRDVEETVLPVCRELGIGFVAYSPLGRGFLTASIGEDVTFGGNYIRAALPRFQPENRALNQALVAKVSDLSKRLGCTPGQVALAWLLSKGDDVVPIPGTKRTSYLEENAAAGDVRLTQTDIEALDGLLSVHPVAGQRYTDEGMKGVNA